MVIRAPMSLTIAAVAVAALLILEWTGYVWSDFYGDQAIILSIILVPLSVALIIRAFGIERFIVALIISVILTYIVMRLNLFFLKWLRIDYLAKWDETRFLEYSAVYRLLFCGSAEVVSILFAIFWRPRVNL